MKMIGISHPSFLSLACSSNPDISVIGMSAITHAARQCQSDRRNSSADAKRRATSPADSTKSCNESCIDSSSSMMAITLDVWPLGMAQTPYRLDQSQRSTSVYSKDETGVNGAAVTLR